MLSEQLLDHLDGLADPVSLDDIVSSAGSAAEPRKRWFLAVAAGIAVLAAVAGATWWTRDDSTGTTTTTTDPAPDTDGSAPDIDGFDLTDGHLLDHPDYEPSSVESAPAGSFGTGGETTDRGRVWVLETGEGDPVMVIDSIPPGSPDAQWLFNGHGAGEAIETGPLAEVDAYIHRADGSAELTPEERRIRDAADRTSGQRRRDVVAWIDDAGNVQAVTAFAGSPHLLEAAEQWAQSADVESVAAAVEAITTNGPSPTIWPATIAVAHRQLQGGVEALPLQVVTFDAPLSHTILVLGIGGSAHSFDGTSGFLAGDPRYQAIVEAGTRTVLLTDTAAFGNPSEEPDLEELIEALRPVGSDDLDLLPPPQPAPSLTPGGDDSVVAAACSGIELVADHPGTPAWFVAVSSAARYLPDAAPALNRLLESMASGGEGGPTPDELEQAIGAPCRQIAGSVSFEIAVDLDAEPPWRLTGEYGGLEDFCLGVGIGPVLQRMTRTQCVDDWDDDAGGLVVATRDGVTTIGGWIRDPAVSAQLAATAAGVNTSEVLVADDERYLRSLAYEPSIQPFGYFVLQVPAIGPGQRIEIELLDANGDLTSTIGAVLPAAVDGGAESVEPAGLFCEVTDQIDAIYAAAGDQPLTPTDRRRVEERVETLAPLIPGEYRDDFRLRYWPVTDVAGLDTNGVATQRAHDRMARLVEQTCGPR